MLKLFLIFVASLVAAVPATFVYLGILNVLKPLLDKIRVVASPELTAKIHKA